MTALRSEVLSGDAGRVRPSLLESDDVPRRTENRAVLGLLFGGLLAVCAVAQTAPVTPAAVDPGPGAPADSVYIPDISRLIPAAQSRESVSASIQILIAMTLLTLLPSIVLMMTCFVRIVIVLSLLRQALGTQQLPPAQIITGLSIFLTLLAMAPTFDQVRKKAIDPYLNGTMQQPQAVAAAGLELRGFMFDQIEAAENVEDVYLMYEYATQQDVPAGRQLAREDVPFTALVPAFMLSELKAAFVIGFRIYLPFLVIDLVVATILVAMGMMMLPPVLISLPFKLLLFVLADGWHLVAGALLASIAA